MALTSGNRGFNVGATTFSAVVLKGAQSASVDLGLSDKSDSGDFDMLPTVRVTDFLDPKISLSVRDITAGNAVTPGTKATLSMKVGDPIGGITTGGGGQSVSLTNAQIVSDSKSHKHRDFSDVSLSFASTSVDGQTSTLVYTAL